MRAFRTKALGREETRARVVVVVYLHPFRLSLVYGTLDSSSHSSLSFSRAALLSFLGSRLLCERLACRDSL